MDSSGGDEIPSDIETIIICNRIAFVKYKALQKLPLFQLIS